MTALPLSGLNNSVAVRFRDVVAFGSIDWIQDDQLQFQVAARIQRDDVVEMRMELTGWPDTVYGLLKILQRTQSPEEGVPRFLAALVRMEERDLALLNDWLLERKQETTDRNPGKNRKASISSLDLEAGATTPGDFAVVMQRYEERKGRFRKETDLRQDPFGLGEEHWVPPNPNVHSSPVHSIDQSRNDAISPTTPPPQASPKREPSGYLKAMEKRRLARRRTDTSAPPKEDFPPPPPAALSPQKANEPEDDFFPPPPASLQHSESAVRPPAPEPTGQPDPHFHEGTLTLTWNDDESYQQVLPDLLNGTILIPNPHSEITRLRLKLPNQTELALRVKSQTLIGDELKLIFRLNMVLSTKLRSAAN